MYKHSSLFGLVISNKEKKFYEIGTWSICLIFGFRHFRFAGALLFRAALPALRNLGGVGDGDDVGVGFRRLLGSVQMQILGLFGGIDL